MRYIQQNGILVPQTSRNRQRGFITCGPAFFSGAGAPSSGFAAAVLALSPFGYWRLNDAGTTVKDFTTHGNDLTWSVGSGSLSEGNPSLMPNGDGLCVTIGGAAHCDIGVNTVKGTAPSATWTLIAFVNVTSHALVANTIFCGGNAAQQFGLDSSGHIVAGAASIANYTASTGTVPTGSASFLGVTLNGDGTGTYYINGASAGAITGATACAPGVLLRIGTFWSDSIYYLVGSCQEVALFGTALTAAQHLALWEAAGGT